MTTPVLINVVDYSNTIGHVLRLQAKFLVEFSKQPSFALFYRVLSATTPGFYPAASSLRLEYNSLDNIFNIEIVCAPEDTYTHLSLVIFMDDGVFVE